MTMKIAFSGLGHMGKPMAMNLIKCGDVVAVHDARQHVLADFASRGVEASTDPLVLVDADIIFLSLPSSEVVEKTLIGDTGIADRLRPGAIVVDTSTISYTTTTRIAQELSTRDIDFLDAPVSGMEARAVDGTLTIMCGGREQTMEAVRPLLALMGNKILYMGASGSGQLAKLVNQLLFDINAAALAEILPMAVKMGLDAEKVGEIVNSGTGRSYASEFFIPRVLDDSFSAGYPLKHAYKDLVSAAELGAASCLPMPVLAAATATYQAALLRGHGDLDKGAMIKVFEELLGVRFRKASTPN
jgi:3-hydroxyisobutyrate dehydrogenase-like beta-hydroxyacid dehydrogenase